MKLINKDRSDLFRFAKQILIGGLLLCLPFTCYAKDLDFDSNPEFDSISATSIAGTLSTAAQPDVTSVGELTALSVANNFTQFNSKRFFVNKASLADNTATNIFRVATTDEASNDGGVYSVYVHVVIGHPGVNSANPCAGKSFVAHFVRSMSASDPGTGSNSAVVEISESAQAGTGLGVRGIGTVTMTVVETSEFNQDIQFQIDVTGTGASTGSVSGMVEVVWSGFSTAPIISQI